MLSKDPAHQEQNKNAMYILPLQVESYLEDYNALPPSTFSSPLLAELLPVYVTHLFQDF